jgi:hypothetical protein
MKVNFVPETATRTPEIERPLASERQTLEYTQTNQCNRPKAAVEIRSPSGD